MKHLLILPIAVFTLVSNLAAQVIWSQDFQSMTAGIAPSGPGISVQGTNGTTQIIKVVDSGTTPADPFGPSTNKSLLFEKTGGTQQINVAFAVPQTLAGVITFDAYSYMSSPDWDTPLLSIYTFDASNNIGTLMTISGTNATVGTPTVYNQTNVWTLNQANQVKIEFFTNNTYNVYINNSLLSFPTIGSNIPYYSSAFTNGITSIRIGTANTLQKESQVYFDNIVLSVPEPASTALLGLAALLFLILMKRRSRHRCS